MKRRLAIMTVMMAICASASAQNYRGKIEVDPFVGFETGASTSSPSTVDPTTGLPISPIDQVGVEKAISYGAFVDYNRWENLGIEGIFLRNPTNYTQHDAIVNQSYEAYSAKVDQYQFGIIYHLKGPDHRFRPYVAGGLGFSHDSDSNGYGSTSFAYNLGGGAKYFITRHLGARADLRYMPAYANTSEGLIQDPYYGTYYGKQRNYFHRLNVAVGLVLSF